LKLLVGVGLRVAFHAGNTGSNPVGDAKRQIKRGAFGVLRFFYALFATASSLSQSRHRLFQIASNVLDVPLGCRDFFVSHPPNTSRITVTTGYGLKAFSPRDRSSPVVAI
jgi:hypothetical protein